MRRILNRAYSPPHHLLRAQLAAIPGRSASLNIRLESSRRLRKWAQHQMIARQWGPVIVALVLLQTSVRPGSSYVVAPAVDVIVGGHGSYRRDVSLYSVAAAGGSETDLAQAFTTVVNSRSSTTKYTSTPLPPSTLTEILKLAQRAPTSFNLQPYTMVVVRSKEAKEKLAKAMLAANAERVNAAPVSVVFAADLESSRLVPKLLDLMRRPKTYSEDYLKNIPFFTSVFSSGYRFKLIRVIMYRIKRIVGLILGVFKAVPRFESPETWAVKNTMMAAMTLMLAATAHGVNSLPMEGIDETRVRKALKIPRRYRIPVVVALGYAAPPEEGKREHGKSERYDLEEVAFDDEFGRPWKG